MCHNWHNVLRRSATKRVCMTVKKACPKCGEEKSEEHWYKYKDGKLASYCNPCRKANARAYQKATLADARERQNRYRERHPERARGAVRAYQARNPDVKNKHYKLWKGRGNLRSYYGRARLEAYEAYGGAHCACCGEKELMFLTIDHVNNDGAEHRRSLGWKRGGRSMGAWLRANGFPPGFQVLCINCNFGKHRNGGVCPHQTRRLNDQSEGS